MIVNVSLKGKYINIPNKLGSCLNSNVHDFLINYYDYQEGKKAVRNYKCTK